MAAIPTLAMLHNRADPMLSSKWACKDATLPFGLPSDFLESVDLPFNNVKIGETVYGGSGYSMFPGSHSISNVNLVLYEDQKATTMKWIQLWKSKIKDFKTGYYFLPGDGSSASTGFKQSMTVQMMDTKHNRLIDFELVGIWPENTSNWSLNYTDDGRMTVSQSFSIDDIIIKF
jgi:hypothetical protein